MELLTDLIILGVVFALGYYIGDAVAMFRVRYLIFKIAESAGVDINKELQGANPTHSFKVAKLRELQTETHNEMLYLYDKESDDFICQAKTLEELAKLSKDNKQILGALVTHNDQTYIFADGKLEDYKP